MGLRMNQKFKLNIAIALIIVNLMMGLLNLDASSITGLGVFKGYHEFFQIASFLLIISLYCFPASKIIKYATVICISVPILKTSVTLFQFYAGNSYISKLMTSSFEWTLWVELIIRISLVIIVLSYRPVESSRSTS